jgi:hypothetical protein
VQENGPSATRPPGGGGWSGSWSAASGGHEFRLPRKAPPRLSAPSRPRERTAPRSVPGRPPLLAGKNRDRASWAPGRTARTWSGPRPVQSRRVDATGRLPRLAVAAARASAIFRVALPRSTAAVSSGRLHEAGGTGCPRCR